MGEEADRRCPERHASIHFSESNNTDPPSSTSRRKFFIVSLSSFSAHEVAEINATFNTSQNVRQNRWSADGFESDWERRSVVVRMPERPEQRMSTICIDWQMILPTFASKYPRCQVCRFSD